MESKKLTATEQTAPKKLKGAEIIVECLIEQGTEYVFGYPGGYIIDVFDALYMAKDRITQILTSHEQGASHAADGYARVTGKVGVVMSTSGPGATNLVTGIATAYMDSVPLVAITGNVPIAFLGRDSFQEVDIAGVTMPVTKHNFIVKDISELADIIRQAFKIAKSGRPGPVLVDVPKNIQQAYFDYVPKKAENDSKRFIKIDEQTEKAVKLISESKRPMLYVGGGAIISAASEELIKFAKMLGAPVACSMMGLGAFPANHPLYTGMIGMHGHAAVAKIMKDCDAVITVGARFSDRVAGDRTKFCKHASIIQIDIDNAEIDKNVATSAHILGDVKTVLNYLNKNIVYAKDDSWAETAAAYVKANAFKYSNLPLCPRKIIESIGANTPDNQLIATDVGQHQMWTAQSYPFIKPRTFLTSGGLGTMGFGMGASIGACLAAKRSVCLITGDGSFHMNLNELSTAVKYNVSLKIFLFNNNTLGMVRQWQTLFYNKHYSSTTLNNPTNYVKLAEAFGAESLVLTKNEDIDEIVKKALAINKPVLVDCRLSTDEFVLPMIPPGKSSDDIITEL